MWLTVVVVLAMLGRRCRARWFERRSVRLVVGIVAVAVLVGVGVDALRHGTSPGVVLAAALVFVVMIWRGQRPARSGRGDVPVREMKAAATGISVEDDDRWCWEDW
jgi:K+ transporter